MTGIAQNIISLKRELPVTVNLVAVTKKKPVSDILAAYGTGHRIFGENRVQELLAKKDQLPVDIEWHLIGHLQSNKVKYIVPFIRMIQSVDSFNLLKTINGEAAKIPRIVDCLLEIHIAKEVTKSGFSINEASEMIESGEYIFLKNIRICGLMGLATFSDDNELVRSEFRFLKESFIYLQNRYFPGESHFSCLSMGMSGDYKIAIDEGSNMIRIGSLIFGERK